MTELRDQPLDGPTRTRPATFWETLKELYEVTQGASRREIWVLALLTAAGTMSEVLAIGSVVPFIALLSSPSATERFPSVARVFHALGAYTRGDQLAAATALLCVAAVAAGLFRIFLNRKTQEFSFSFGHRMAVEIQRRSLLQPYSWHVENNSSEQLATIDKVETVASAVVLPLIQSAAAIVQMVVVMLLLLNIAPLPTLIAGVGLAVSYFCLGALVKARLDSSSQWLETAYADRIRVIQEGFGGIRDVILDGSQATVLDQFRALDGELASVRARTAFLSSVPRYLIEPAGIVIIAGLALLLSGKPGGLVASLPILGALALGAQRLLPLAQQLYTSWSNVAATRSLIDDVVRRLRLTIPRTAVAGPKLGFERTIEFRNAAYAYAGSAEPAVAGLNFTIAKGSRLGLIGATGSGKSTTADLLMGLLEPTAGEIVIDDVVLGDDNRQSWRANIAHVPQLLFLADASIAQNIAMSVGVDMARVRAAAELAQLDGFVGSLPSGYDTHVGERGARISGGQRQRLAIARAIYKDAAVLVLDEATSALDDDTENAVAGALDTLQAGGRTIIIIAHRSRLIATCDQLIRLERGRIRDGTLGSAARTVTD